MFSFGTYPYTGLPELVFHSDTQTAINNPEFEEEGMVKPKKLICHVHDDIISLTEEVIDLLDSEKLDMRKIKPKLKNIIMLTQAAKEMGQNMERRLHEYKDSIIGLGYKK